MQVFWSKEESIVQEWMHVLSKHCVRLDFEKKYKILSKLGAGGYAKVKHSKM